MSINRDLFASELAVLKAVAATGDRGITLAQAEEIMAPAPAIQTLTVLYQFDLIKHPENESGVKQVRWHTITSQGERTLRPYTEGKKQAKRDPKQHEKIPEKELLNIPTQKRDEDDDEAPSPAPAPKNKGGRPKGVPNARVMAKAKR